MTITNFHELISAAKRIAALDAELTREVEALRELFGSKPATAKPVKAAKVKVAKRAYNRKAAPALPAPAVAAPDSATATNGHVPKNRVLLVPKRVGRPPKTTLPDSVRAGGSVGERVYDMLAQHGPKTLARLSELLGVSEDSVRRSLGYHKDKFADHIDAKGCVCLRAES